MKKFLALLLLISSVWLTSCNDTDGDGNKDINIHIDLDSTGNKIKNKAEELGDSIQVKSKRIGKDIDRRMDSVRL